MSTAKLPLLLLLLLLLFLLLFLLLHFSFDSSSVTLVSGLLMFLLFVSELSFYLSTEVRDLLITEYFILSYLWL